MTDPRDGKVAFDRGVRSRIALNVAAVSLLAVVLVAILNYGLDLWSRDHDVRQDLTRTGFNRLDDETRAFLRRIETPIEVYLVTGIDDRLRAAARTDPAADRPDSGILKDVYRPLLEVLTQRVAAVVGEAAQVNPRVRLQTADASSQPDLADAIARRLELGPGQLRNRLIVRDPTTGAQQSFDAFTVFDLDLGGPDRMVGFRPPLLRGDLVEAHLVAGIRAVLADEPLRVLFSVGHGERELPAVRQLLVAEHGRPGEIDLEDGVVPEDCDVLVIASPERPFGEPAHEAVRRHLDGGGRLLLLQGAACREPFDRLLETFGMTMTGMRVGHPVENVRQQGPYVLQGSTFIRIPGAAPHPITEVPARQRLPVAFGFARAYELGPDYRRDRYERTVLATSGPEGLGMPWIDDGVAWRMAPERGTRVGDMPFFVAVAATDAGDDGMRAVVVGSDAWLDVSVLVTGFHLANTDVLRNTLAWLANRERLITGSPRSFRGNLAPLDASEHRTYAILVVGAVPALLLLAGLLVALVRRRP